MTEPKQQEQCPTCGGSKLNPLDNELAPRPCPDCTPAQPVEWVRGDEINRSVKNRGPNRVGGCYEDPQPVEQERPTLTDLAAIARAGNIAGIDPEWLASALTTANQQIEELKHKLDGTREYAEFQREGLRAAEAKVEELTRERDQWKRAANGDRDGVVTHEYHLRVLKAVVAERVAAEAQRDTLREKASLIRGAIGQLRTPTGLFGRDPETQVAEYERRVEQIADDLEAWLVSLSTPPDKGND